MTAFTSKRAAGFGVALSALNPKNLLLTVVAGAAIAQTGASTGGQAVALADLRGGGEANAVFCETEDDLRRADEILNAMTPPEGDGRRTDVAHYEVLLDVEF